MNEPSTKSFASWAVLVSLGWLSFFWINGAAGLFFMAAWFVVIPREQRHRVVPRREMIWIAGFLVAFVILCVLVKLFTPDSVSKSFERIIQHPAVIIAFWLLSLWLGFRGWRRSILRPDVQDALQTNK